MAIPNEDKVEAGDAHNLIDDRKNKIDFQLRIDGNLEVGIIFEEILGRPLHIANFKTI